jgi:hypothetical protein
LKDGAAALLLTATALDPTDAQSHGTRTAATEEGANKKKQA